MSPKRRNKYRDQQRMLEHLRSKCMVCLQTQYPWQRGGRDTGIWVTGGVKKLREEHISPGKVHILQSIPVPCCNKYFHECCLVEWFKIKKECPHCRTRLLPWVQGTRPEPDTEARGGGTPICLCPQYLSTDQLALLRQGNGGGAPLNHYDDYLQDDGFDIVPQLSAPPGWARYRRFHNPIVRNPRPQRNVWPG